jgi:hypothetical protein
MTGAARFICSDPDIGDVEFADVEAVLDALEATLVQPATPLFDAARQSWQPAGIHPEVRAAWEARLRFRPPAVQGLALPPLPSVTALVRSLPADPAEPRRPARSASLSDGAAPGRSAPRFAAVGMAWALVLLAIVGWIIVVFATRLADVAAGAVGVPGRK